MADRRTLSDSPIVVGPLIGEIGEAGDAGEDVVG